MPNATVISPDVLNPIGDRNPYDLGANAKCLAQGDSWFSIGAVPFWSTTNLLSQLVLKEGAVIVNCAHPGRELAEMTAGARDGKFLELLRGKLSYRWDLILLSGGGNDLIDRLNTSPAKNRVLRLLLNPDERSVVGDDVRGYISEDGWAQFASDMNAMVDAVLAERDKGQNKDVSVLMHTYDYATPRNVGAGLSGPWLYPALKDLYRVPEEHWLALARLLIDRLADLLEAIAFARRQRGLIVVRTTGTIAPAKLGSSGTSGDWENEIHPDAHGYVSLAARLAPTVDRLLFTTMAPVVAHIGPTVPALEQQAA